jgi:hypothetical protein
MAGLVCTMEEWLVVGAPALSVDSLWYSSAVSLCKLPREGEFIYGKVEQTKCLVPTEDSGFESWLCLWQFT